MRIDEAAQRHWAHLEGLGQLATADSSRTWLTKFLKFCHEREMCELAGLNAELLAQFQRHLTWTPGPRGQLYSQSTLFSALRMLRLFLRWLHHSDLFLVDLGEGWRLSRPPDSNRKVPSVEAVSRLLLVPDARTPVGVRNRAILELLYGTGVRSHECYATDIGQLDLKASRVTAHDRWPRSAPFQPVLGGQT
jgi:integrase/recombinase XerD